MLAGDVIPVVFVCFSEVLAFVPEMKIRTLFAYVALSKCLCCQAGFGISANTFLLLFRIFILVLADRPKPTDLTTCHLAFVHIVMLLTVSFLFSPDAFETWNLWNDLNCKALFYSNKVMRGLFICIACLLSIIQAIPISPSTSWLAKFKYKSTHFIFYIFFLWILCLPAVTESFILWQFECDLDQCNGHHNVSFDIVI